MDISEGKVGSSQSETCMGNSGEKQEGQRMQFEVKVAALIRKEPKWVQRRKKQNRQERNVEERKVEIWSFRLVHGLSSSLLSGLGSTFPLFQLSPSECLLFHFGNIQKVAEIKGFPSISASLTGLISQRNDQLPVSWCQDWPIFKPSPQSCNLWMV